MCSHLIGRHPRGAYNYITLGGIVICISLALLLALWFSQHFIYWYFVFGLVTGGSTLFYGLVWVCLSRRAPRPDPTRPDPTELAARANNNNNNYPTCGANNVDPQLFQQNLYAGSACAEKTDMPPISESPAGFSPMGPPQQQTSLAGYGQPLDEAPQFQPEGPNDALALENKVLTAVATVVPPVEYGSPSPLSPTAPTQDFEEEARL